MKRTWKRIAGGIFALGMLGSMGAISASAEETTIQLWHYYEGEVEVGLLKSICQEYCDAHEGINIDVTYVPREELTKQYTMGSMSGELADIGMVDNPEMAAYIQMGAFADITDYFNEWDEKDVWYDGPMSSCTGTDGRLYGLPQNSNCLALYYDTVIFDELGLEIPTTWDELSACCATIKEAYPDKYPLGFSAFNNEEGTFQFTPFLISAGGSFDNLAGEAGVKALTYWCDLLNNGYVSKDVINWGQGDLTTQWCAGNVVMMVNGPWNFSTIEEQAPGKEYGVCLLPKDQEYASVLGGENFVVTSACEDKDLGWDILSWICNGENMARYCEGVGKFMPRSDYAEYSDIWETNEKLMAFNEGMQYAVTRGPSPQWGEQSGYISTAIQEALTGEKTPEQALNDAQAGIDALK